jgi:hypothetical protein
VYRFGCGFIHLSNFHDYHSRDPFRALPQERREDIVRYLLHYHGGSVTPESTFEEIAIYAPRALGKITSNLDLYLNDLEQRLG